MKDEEKKLRLEKLEANKALQVVREQMEKEIT